MPFRYHIDPQRGLVEILLWGNASADVDALVQRAIRTDPDFRPGLHVLYDFRRIAWLPTLEDVERNVAALLTRADEVRGTRRAILGRSSRPAQRALTDLAADFTSLIEELDVSIRFFEHRGVPLRPLPSRSRHQRRPSPQSTCVDPRQGPNPSVAVAIRLACRPLAWR